MMWLPNVLLTSMSTCVMSLEETRASSFISCGKPGEEEQASGTQTPTCHQMPSWAGSPGVTMGVCPAKTSFLPLGCQGWGESPPCPWDLCEGLYPVVVGGEVTECQPGWEGIGVQPRWEGTWGYCAQDCESKKPLRR